ncbi:MAG: hypothetical protein KDA38_11810 [Planctomycetales bacterium]|nr:hypothetical protein [Planctomycetales bacterium]
MIAENVAFDARSGIGVLNSVMNPVLRILVAYDFHPSYLLNDGVNAVAGYGDLPPTDWQPVATRGQPRE